jgi:hypothetical protein
MRIFRFVELVILGIMIPFETTQYLCMSSCFIGLSAVTLYFLQKYTISFLTGVLCMTSLNHWRDYQYGGWRYRMDIAWVNLCLLYGFLCIFYEGNEFQQYMLLSMIACLALFFQISESCIRQWSVFHMSIHLYVSFFVPLLYIL